MNVQTAQATLKSLDDASHALAPVSSIEPGLVLVFASATLLSDARLAPALSAAFPGAHVVGCSTAGEISAAGVRDDTCVVTGMRFDHGTIRLAKTRLANMEESQAAGKRLGEQLPREGLSGVIVLGQGVRINGSALVEGLTERIGRSIPVTGGLAGDGGAFQRTWVMADGAATDDGLLAIGLYGKSVHFAHGSFGGWQPFGPARKVTRCKGNVLFELDGEPALELYKRYLGEQAKGLPASGLLYPFAMLGRDHNAIGLIRTILGVDEKQGSLTLAGEIDPDGYLKLMHASTDALVDGAIAAAEAARTMLDKPGKGLALLVSCVGRKLVMGDRVDEEVEAVGEVFGRGAMLTGFYSYGEISPFTPSVDCKLHNQTMTITYISEG